jgi:lipopolysaccharide transport system permease protein
MDISTDTATVTENQRDKGENINEPEWDLIIQPQTGWFDLHLKDLWKYRDLIILFVRRDFVAVYKQTILGPLWFLIQPVLSTIVFTIIFGKIAQIPTDGVPPVLFYMAGLTCWNYFADCLTKTSNTFTANANIFGKVYFPRLAMPISVVISNLIKFGIQLLIFLAFYLFYIFKGADILINEKILVLPFLVLIMAGIGLGMGIIISSLTTKYRDLQHLIGFGVQLFMYATPIVYPLSTVPEKHQWIVLLNPMTSIVEAFKYIFLSAGYFDLFWLGYSFVFMVLVLFFGTMIFSRIEKSFMDTV